MITYANFQQSVVAYILSHPGERVRVTLKQLRTAGIREFSDFEAWTEKHGIQSKSIGTDFILWHGELPPPPPAPPTYTSVDQLHPGNRFRLMMGQPLLPQ